MSNEIKQDFEKRIDSLITQIKDLNKKDDSNDEIISNLSKYLCILIAGYTEKLFVYKLSFYFKNKAHPKLAKYLSTSLKHTTNLNINKIEKILESFDTEWTKKLRQERNYQDYKDTLQSIYDNRNKLLEIFNRKCKICLLSSELLEKSSRQRIKILILIFF